ncbi:aryl-phospho-beta-D-glucosidase BglC (GH1 family) [Novosphingobium sp. PhB55]|uniref:cellulase family glycosylhydrolase n=1 Tax=Novosphingobium sp. PhB55 TaxID=2485106 RepID=UPI0010DF084F|nr:cellulase family glycosylhydrolase [Novosphingobium sp. PhB55]TDW63100.1 aryl-phospho-beta-D-glucosidase BglC (GH1 family) [Novosphingobium sp. PhB55]
MPPEDQDLDTSSLVVILGQPIEDDELPFAKDRKIHDMGPHLAPMLFQRAEDHLDYCIPLGRFLEPGEVVAGVKLSYGPVTDPPLTITKVGYAPTGVAIWITDGGEDERYDLQALVTTSQGRLKLFRFIMRTRGIADYIAPIYVTVEPIEVGVGINPNALPGASVSDGVLSAGAVPGASVSDGELSAAEDVGVARLAPAALSLTATVGESTAKVATLVNTGTAALAIDAIAVSAGFTQTNTCGASLEPGASCSITVTHAPKAEGSTAGTLTVETDVGDVTSTLAGTGTAAPVLPALGALSTSGNQFVKANGDVVRLRSINWFGAESTNNFPHGIWANGYKILIDKIAAWGFNCIRVPFSGDTFKSSSKINGVSDEFAENLAFIVSGTAATGYTYVTPFEAMDLIVAYAETKGLYIVFDHHRRAAGDGADGAPTDGSYSQANWLATWALVANRYKSAPNVIGADVHNEPHDLDWATWAGLAETCGNHIHTIAPHWIIFVEGVGSVADDFYWWGGQLAGVATRPVVLTVPNKLAYSPHEYGQSVGTQTWLRYDSNPSLPANYPANLYQVWHDHWGFIFEQNIAPIWIGEFGGHYGVDGTGAATKPHGTYEKQWTTELGKYLAGDFTGSGVNALPAGKMGASFAYWSFNPNSGDTGGLLQDDWNTPQAVKLATIAPFLA